jgi:hypothetical protein
MRRSPSRLWYKAVVGSDRERVPAHDAFGVFGTTLSGKIGVFQSASLKVVPVSPNASQVGWLDGGCPFSGRIRLQGQGRTVSAGTELALLQ